MNWIALAAPYQLEKDCRALAGKKQLDHLHRQGGVCNGQGCDNTAFAGALGCYIGVTYDMYACGRCGYGTVCRDFGRSRWAKSDPKTLWRKSNAMDVENGW